MMKRFLFDQYQNIDYYAYELESKFLRVVILEYGGIIQTLIDKHSGVDIVHGYETIKEYFDDQDTYTGAIIGRYCNRIEKGSFILNDNEYHLHQNNNGNTLHGGKFGFNQKVFSSLVNQDKLILTICSPHLEEGFPGTLTLEVCYQVEDQFLNFSYAVSSDEDTIFNITNHAYFNLNGKNSILSHSFKIPAEEIACLNQDGLTINETMKIKETAFDFNEFKSLEEAIIHPHPQIVYGGGIDHHFLVSGSGFRNMLVSEGEALSLIVKSDLPGFHFYIGNFLKSYFGKSGVEYAPRTGFCVETQFYPNNINNQQFPKSILKKGDIKRFTTQYCIVNKEVHYED